MIFDATDMDRSLFDRTFDVCVIGSGPAGMTLARALAATGFDVALMEGGGLEFTEESQDLYLGEVTGLDNFELDVVASAVLRRLVQSLVRPHPAAGGHRFRGARLQSAERLADRQGRSRPLSAGAPTRSST